MRVRKISDAALAKLVESFGQLYMPRVVSVRATTDRRHLVVTHPDFGVRVYLRATPPTRVRDPIEVAEIAGRAVG